jgi:hypothetical protein
MPGRHTRRIHNLGEASELLNTLEVKTVQAKAQGEDRTTEGFVEALLRRALSKCIECTEGTLFRVGH